MKYYDMQAVEKEKLIKSMEAAVASLNEKQLGQCKSPNEFIDKMFDDVPVRDMCILLSQLPTFSKEFSMALSHNLDLLACAKKLKYFTNNTFGQNSILFKQLAEAMKSPIEGMQEQIDKLFAVKEFANMRVKDYMLTQSFDNAKAYVKND